MENLFNLISKIFVLVFIGFLFLFNPVSAVEEISVGSRDFPESVLVAEILSSAIERNTDIKVNRKFHLGSVKVCVNAMQNKVLDIYPDYTGSLMHNLIGELDTEGFLDLYLREKLERDYNFLLTDKLGFDNSFVLVVKKDFATRYKLKTLSDLELLLARNSALNDSLRVGFKHGFLSRPDGYKQLQKVYSFNFKNLNPLEYNIAYSELKAGHLDLIDAFSTDSRLVDSDLQILVDDRKALLAYDSVYLMRADLVKKYPDLNIVLKKLSHNFSNEKMLELNQELRSGRSYKEVADKYLDSIYGDDLFLNNTVGKLSVEDSSFSKFKLSSKSIQNIKIFIKALRQHILLSSIPIFLASLVGIIIGFWIAENERFAKYVLGLASVTQVIPSLALLAFLVPVLGLGLKPALAALFIYALLPIIQNTYSGIKSIAPEYIDLANSLALSKWTIITKVKFMMIIPAIIAGLRTSSVVCVGAATLASFVGAGGFGDLIKTGIDLNDNYMIMLGALPVAFIALSLSYALGALETRLLKSRQI